MGRKRYIEPLPSVEEILSRLTALRLETVHFLACPDDNLRAGVIDGFVREGSRRLTDYEAETNLCCLDRELDGTKRRAHDLHRGLLPRPSPYAIIVEFTSLIDAYDEHTLWYLFGFLSWVVHGGEWPRNLRILAVGRKLPWYIQNIEQQTDGVAVVLRDEK